VVAVSTVALRDAADAAAADGSTVWCAAGGRLVSYEATGAPLAEAAAPPELVALAAAGPVLAAALAVGEIAWLDPATGEERRRVPVGGKPLLAAGGGAVWAVDRLSGRAWRLGDEEVLGAAVSVPEVDAVAPDGDRLWWTSPADTLLREGERTVDLEAGPDERGAMAVCFGSVWVSVAGGLARVGAWAADRGLTLPAPEGPVPFLACADGILVGGSGRRGLFVLDPRVDADVRHLDVDLGGELAALVATGDVAWAFPAGKAQARLVAVRPTG
jgi:hypothetical protein